MLTLVRHQVRIVRPIWLLKKTAGGEHLQIFLEEVEAKVSQIHDARFSCAILGDLQDVCRYLNAASVMSLPSAS